MFTTNGISDALSMKGLVKKLCRIFRQHEDLCCACDKKRWSLLIIVVTSGRGSRREFIGFVGTGVNLCVQDIATYAVCLQLKPIIASG